VKDHHRDGCVGGNHLNGEHCRKIGLWIARLPMLLAEPVAACPFIDQRSGEQHAGQWDVNLSRHDHRKK
jgi:hypothetical protein